MKSKLEIGSTAMHIRLINRKKTKHESGPKIIMEIKIHWTWHGPQDEYQQEMHV